MTAPPECPPIKPNQTKSDQIQPNRMEDPDPDLWDSLPLFANGPASYLFKDQPVGSTAV